jgi:hypothetical protein
MPKKHKYKARPQISAETKALNNLRHMWDKSNKQYGTNIPMPSIKDITFAIKGHHPEMGAEEFRNETYKFYRDFFEDVASKKITWVTSDGEVKESVFKPRTYKQAKVIHDRIRTLTGRTYTIEQIQEGDLPQEYLQAIVSGQIYLPGMGTMSFYGS